MSDIAAHVYPRGWSMPGARAVKRGKAAKATRLATPSDAIGGRYDQHPIVTDGPLVGAPEGHERPRHGPPVSTVLVVPSGPCECKVCGEDHVPNPPRGPRLARAWGVWDGRAMAEPRPFAPSPRRKRALRDQYDGGPRYQIAFRASDAAVPEVGVLDGATMAAVRALDRRIAIIDGHIAIQVTPAKRAGWEAMRRRLMMERDDATRSRPIGPVALPPHKAVKLAGRYQDAVGNAIADPYRRLQGSDAWAWVIPAGDESGKSDPGSLWADHLRLAAEMAGRWEDAGVAKGRLPIEVEDAARDALYDEAAMKFDPTRGVPFEAYARDVVPKAIWRALRKWRPPLANELPTTKLMADDNPGDFPDADDLDSLAADDGGDVERLELAREFYVELPPEDQRLLADTLTAPGRRPKIQQAAWDLRRSRPWVRARRDMLLAELAEKVLNRA